MTRPRLLDLFCGAGGAAMGYHRAGFDVVGVDIAPQPRYPFEFIQADVTDIWWRGPDGVTRFRGPLSTRRFEAVHASPPCQAYVRSGMVAKDGRHLALVEPVRRYLEGTGLPWVIENVPGAPLRPDVMLCGSMFGLAIRRHRLFEGSPPLAPWTLACDHSRAITGVYGHPHGKGGAWRNGKRSMLPSDHATWSREMGIDWMTSKELAQAIPPAYTEFIGTQLLRAVERAA